MNKLNLPENIVRLRREKKLTQEELADFMGVTKGSVSKWEKGINIPDLLILLQMASFFDVPLDELIGYEAQLSGDQIRRQYAELSEDFARLPFPEALGKVRTLVYKYYACYPFLLQASILCCNHYMLAETEEEGRLLLEEAVGWCERILENCCDVDVCSDALALKARLHLQLGKVAEAIEALEPSGDPRIAGQNGSLLAQAYQMAGETEKAGRYAQVKYYLDLTSLIDDAILILSLNGNNLERCTETVRRIKGVMELYHLESLHPNLAAQFHYQCAVVYGINGREEEALAALGCFGNCVEKLLNTEQIRLHGDAYFDLLDEWIERLPLGGMPPRDKSFIRQSLQEPLAHPAFDGIREREEFRRLVCRMTMT